MRPLDRSLRHVEAALSYDAVPVDRCPRAPSDRSSGPSSTEVLAPQIRPFRGLRYAPTQSATSKRSSRRHTTSSGPLTRRCARSPRAERGPLDAPAEEVGDAEDERYRRAARTLAAWRSDGTFHKDPRPAIYVQSRPTACRARTSSGRSAGFARLRLEPLEPGLGVLPHERTLSAAREDRYRLLRATGVNTSSVIGLYDDPPDEPAILATLAAGPADIDVRDDDGVRHRLWVVEADGACSPGRGAIAVASVDRSRSPTATTATRRPCAIAMNGA
jgi:hypothetical protein